jgi:alpha-L-rhamnosidase
MSTLPPSDSIDASIRSVHLRTQYDPELLGVPGAGLRLSWRVEAAPEAGAQVGYEVEWGAADDALTSTGAVLSGSSLAVAAPGPALLSRERRVFRVRIATASGWSTWSEPVLVEAGIGPSDWQASVISIPSTLGGASPILRHEFSLDAIPDSARLYASFLGLGEVWINGTRVSDEHLAPGWTSYRDRILISTVDVAELLVAGDNAIAIALADGWYRGRMGFARRSAIYGEQLGALAQLEVTTAGVDHVILTGPEWTGGFGDILAAGIYDGTDLDLRLPGVREASRAGFTDAAAVPVEILPVDLGLFAPRVASPVRTIAEFDAAIDRRPHATVLDLGQNISGWMRLTVRGEAGSTVTVRHAEILGPDDELYTAALRTARAADTYVLAESGETVLEPVFTFHGFRYADVVGAEVVAATGIAISSAQQVRSTFRSSHPQLDQFHSNVMWSQRDNFVSLPTDCPQRDERLGWTGDAQAFAATASTLFDSESFWLSWLRDLELDQTDEGGVASVVPDMIFPDDMQMGGGPANPMGRAGWADAATIVPLAVYRSSGSDEVLVQQLDSMRRWVGHLQRRAGDGVVLPHEPFQYGDWLDPDAPGDQPWKAKVDSDFVANAFYVHSTRLLARAERLVGDASRATDYETLADAVAAATWTTWGEQAVTTQTGAALALEFDLAPSDRRAGIGDSLAENVRSANGRISTGFLGTPLVLDALNHSGRLAEAYLMLLCREAPSWLYQVDRGATTVWERWDAIRPDGSIHSGDMDTEREGDSMLSFNHYAYGAMIDWVYRTVAGLAPVDEAPGYRTVVVAPRPAATLTSAAASIETGYGRLAIDWHLDADGTFVADLEVPYGVTAHLDLPSTDPSHVTVDGETAPTTTLQHGTYVLRVTQPALA